MKKFISLTVVILLALTTSNAQLLYKISGKGLNKPSYIVGTQHFSPGTFADSITGMKNAMNEVKQVYGEVVMSELSKPEITQKIQATMILPEGKTLKDFFSGEELQDVYNYISEVSGLDMNNPMVESQLSQLTPTAIVAQMDVMLSIKYVQDYNPQNPLDMFIQKEAIEKGKKVGGLEEADYQINLLYGGKPEEGCKGLLCAARNIGFVKEQTKDLVNAYQHQDIKALEEAFTRKMGNDCDMTEEFMTKLVTNRNNNWVKIMPNIMKQAPTLFAVGAGHLIGEKGVLNQLRKAGYTVTAVK
ncbi:TraB/GumN family protein [Falsiporphyromonas endometrii]|uniref:TraB/GumN family protein n=1 Tax=Falsiporphyromonas endometrii TaxID=1387297 RepID=A0ABV9K7B0_9PORP